jgi:integrase
MVASARHRAEERQETMNRARGEGSIFRERYRDKRTREWKTSSTWTIKYSYLGNQRKESSGSAKRSDAAKLLQRRLSEIASGRLIGPGLERRTYEDLRAMLLNDYKINARKSLERVEDAVAHLDVRFAGMRALDLTADKILAYIAARQAEKAANGTINRELSALKRMFRLGQRAGLVPLQLPHIPGLEEHNVRQGFFEHPEARVVFAHLPADLVAPVEIAYITGWRIKSEILTRQKGHLDLHAGWLRLEPGETKNRKGRMFPLTPALRAILEWQLERTRRFEQASGQIVPWLFHRNGQPIKSFRRAWLTACARAGLAGRIPHDFRRTAIRNLERAGVARSTAMAMVGHLTESIYRRYAIQDEASLTEGAVKLAAFHASQATVPVGDVVTATRPYAPVALVRVQYESKHVRAAARFDE